MTPREIEQLRERCVYYERRCQRSCTCEGGPRCYHCIEAETWHNVERALDALAPRPWYGDTDPAEIVERIVRGSLCYECGWIPGSWTEHHNLHPTHKGIAWHPTMKPDDFSEMCCAAANWIGEVIRP